MKNINVCRFVISALIFLVVVSTSIPAEVITFELVFEYSSATAPAGISPWLKVVLDDEGTPGSVKLLLNNNNLINNEHTKKWYLNLDPLLDPELLSFTEIGKTGTFDSPNINTGINSFKADGDGYYDILLAFGEADANSKFGAGESIAYEITGIAFLLASSFCFESALGGGRGQYLTAAHVGGIYDTDSGWVTVPEPASLWFLGAGVAFLIRKRRQ